MRYAIGWDTGGIELIHVHRVDCPDLKRRRRPYDSVEIVEATSAEAAGKETIDGEFGSGGVIRGKRAGQEVNDASLWEVGYEYRVFPCATSRTRKDAGAEEREAVKRRTRKDAGAEEREAVKLIRTLVLGGSGLAYAKGIARRLYPDVVDAALGWFDAAGNFKDGEEDLGWCLDCLDAGVWTSTSTRR